MPYLWRVFSEMVQAELQPLLNMSVSQTYRRLNAAKVRQQVSHLGDNVEDIPDSQMEALSKLPSEQWQEAWAEITATAPGGRITGKHVKRVVARRLQTVPDEKLEPEQPLQTSPSSYEVGQIVLIHCEDSAASQRCRRYSGC
jgi:uncharacterized membrane-anchored protein